jgi:SAM-dependent methyltransferase
MSTITLNTNKTFYGNIELDKFREIAEISGFDSAPDISLIYATVKRSKVLLEIGLGYGRCIDAILDRGYQGKIYAVERVEKFANLAKQKYAESTVEVIFDDILHAELPEQLDCVLWLWSGIMELTPDEQEAAIGKVAQNLKSGGNFFIELPAGELKVIGQKVDDRKIVVNAEWGTLEAYLPSEDEIRKAAEKGGFDSVHSLRYMTEKGLKRVMYVLNKKQQ